MFILPLNRIIDGHDLSDAEKLSWYTVVLYPLFTKD